EGWAKAETLAYDDGADPALPVRLHCQGPEASGRERPWQVEISYSRADAELVPNVRQTLALDAPVVAGGPQPSWLLTVRRTLAAFLRVTGRNCAEKTRNSADPFAVAVYLPGNLLNGCCR